MSEIMDQYYKLREYLGIDVLDIEGAFERVPRILDEAGELSARAARNLALAKYNITIAEANAAANIRMLPVNGKVPGQTTIDSMVPLDPEVQQAVKDWGDALHEATAIEKLHKTLEGQWIMLHKVSDLTISGYFNPAVVLDRTAMRQRAHDDGQAERQRRAREHIERPIEERPVSRRAARPAPASETLRAKFNRRYQKKED